MDSTHFGITNPLVYGVPVFVTLIGIELYLSIKHERHLYEWKDLGASVSVGIGASILAVFTKAAAIAMLFFFFEISILPKSEKLKGILKRNDPFSHLPTTPN